MPELSGELSSMERTVYEPLISGNGSMGSHHKNYNGDGHDLAECRCCCCCVNDRQAAIIAATYTAVSYQMHFISAS
jgi:hypothetical protein